MGIFGPKVVRSTSGKAMQGRPNPKIPTKNLKGSCTSASGRRRGNK